MAAVDVAVNRRSSLPARPGGTKRLLGNYDIKLKNNKKMTMQHTVRSKKLDERQLFKLIQTLDGQQNQRLLNIDKQVSEISKDLEKLVADQEAARLQRIARRAAIGAEIEELDATLNKTMLSHRRRSTQFDAFAFHLKRESENIRSPTKASRALFRFDSRGNQLPDLSPVQSSRSREMDCSPNDIAIMALKEMNDFAANHEDGDEDGSRVPSRAATSAIESVSIRSVRSSDDETDERKDVTKTPTRHKPVAKEQTKILGGNDWTTILKAVVDGKLLDALKKEIANPTAPPKPALKVSRPRNVFIKSRWAQLASAARDDSRQKQTESSSLNAPPSTADTGPAPPKTAPTNPFLKRVLALKAAPEPEPEPAPPTPPVKFPLRRRAVNRGVIASNILLGMSMPGEEVVPKSPSPELIKKEVSFAVDVEPEQQGSEDGTSSHDDDSQEEDGPMKSSCDVPDCICHCSAYRRSAPARMRDDTVDDYYNAISRSYAASTGQAMISPVFQSQKSPRAWSTLGRRSAPPPPSPTPSEILEGVEFKDKTDTGKGNMDYTELDAISSIRRPMKGSNREMLLKEKEANARITFQLMRQKMNEKHPHDFNRNYGTPTPNWKILNPLKLRHKINQSSPLYTNWGL